MLSKLTRNYPAMLMIGGLMFMVISLGIYVSIDWFIRFAWLGFAVFMLGLMLTKWSTSDDKIVQESRS